MARIQIVEDEPVSALALSAALRKLGHEVTGIASSGEEAIALVSAQAPDLILVDIHLGGAMDGIEAAQRISAPGGTPVIYLTASAGVRSLDRAIATRPIGFLTKPVSDHELQVALETALARRALELEVLERELYLRALLDAIPHSIAVRDREGRHLLCNRAYADRYGLPPEQILGKTLVEFAPEREARARAQTKDLEVLEGRSIEPYDLSFSDSAGAPRIWRIYKVGLRDKDGAVAQVLSVGTDITAQRRAEDELRASEARFHDFASASGDWFWETDAENRFVWISEPFGAASGEPQERVYGRRREEIADLSPDRGELAAEPWKSHLEALSRRASFRDFRYRRTGPKGEQWFSTSGVPVFDAQGGFRGYRGVGSEVTAQMESERRAHQADLRLQAALGALDEGVALFDRNDRLVIWNERYREIYRGLEDRIVPGESFEDLIRAAQQRGLYAHTAGGDEAWIAERMAAHRAADSVIEQELASGRWLRIAERRTPEGGTIGARADITERKRAEEALKARTAALEAANAELDSFSWSVSHDLRAPLRAVQGFAKILAADHAGKLDAEGRRLLQTICDASENMDRLILDLLAFARLGRAALAKVRVEMGALAREAGDALLPGERRVEFIVHDMPPARGDRTLLGHVWANLLANAIKFSGTKDAPRVEAGGVAGGTEDCYYVRDNGVGFDMRYRDKLFGVFQRLHSAEEFPGSGVGLAIVQRIVHRHGGRVRAEGKSGEGATFYFTLPHADD